jgi:hypothetical protein
MKNGESEETSEAVAKRIPELPIQVRLASNVARHLRYGRHDRFPKS